MHHRERRYIKSINQTHNLKIERDVQRKLNYFAWISVGFVEDIHPFVWKRATCFMKKDPFSLMPAIFKKYFLREEEEPSQLFISIFLGKSLVWNTEQHFCKINHLQIKKEYCVKTEIIPFWSSNPADWSFVCSRRQAPKVIKSTWKDVATFSKVAIK